MESMLELAETIGLDKVDAEVVVWIEQGVYDEDVELRAEQLGMSRPQHDLHRGLQRVHRILHPEGPYGYEFCGECEKILN